jgi:hypothetical protein
MSETKTFEVYFNDLTEEAKERFLEFECALEPSELLHEFEPIAIIQRDIEIDLDEDPESQGKVATY